MTREEAIEIIKRNCTSGSDLRKACELFIPELTENEDERIRKFLIDYFGIIKSTLSDDGIWKGFQIEEILAFLEKQKEQKPIKLEVYEVGKGTTICGQDYKCKKDYKAGNCWYIKDVIYHCGRDGYLTDQNGISWSCTPEWFKEYIYSNAEWAEKEKSEFVGGQFIQCNCTLDNGLKKGEHYWLEYVGDDTYVGRSDNILNQKFHITPRQLFTLFTQQLEDKQKEQIPYTDFVIKPHKGDDTNPYDMSASEALEYAIKRGFGIPLIDSEVYVDERHITQTIGNILRWADEHPKEQKPVECLKAERDKWYICIKDFYAGGKKCASTGELIQAKGGMYMMGREDISEWFRKAYYDEIKPTEWSEDNIKELTDFEAAMLHIGMSFFGGSAGLNPNNTNEVKKQAKLLLELVPKQEWSEEDEKIANEILDHFNTENAEWFNWFNTRFKSLRPQPKQEWSEEDKKKISKLKTFIAQEWFNKENRRKALDMIDALSPQPKQEWSEEDESQLDDIEKAISNYYDLNHAPQYHYWLEQKLKSIRSQIIDSTPLYTIEQVDEKIREAQEWSEEQKEQKPVEYLDKDKIYAIMKKLHELAFSHRILIYSDEYKKINEITSDVRSLLDYPIETKPAEWSNLDKDILNDAITAVDLLGNDESFNKSNPNLANAFRVAKDWLETLPGRFNVKQEKQEWTKEDENMLLKLLMMIDTANDYEEIRLWLCTKLNVVTSTELDRKLKSDMTQLERYISEARTKKGFYWNNKEVSWEEIPLEERKHDYPYYFKNGLDCYPFRCLDDEGICIKID